MPVRNADAEVTRPVSEGRSSRTRTFGSRRRRTRRRRSRRHALHRKLSRKGIARASRYQLGREFPTGRRVHRIKRFRPGIEGAQAPMGPTRAGGAPVPRTRQFHATNGWTGQHGRPGLLRWHDGTQAQYSRLGQARWKAAAAAGDAGSHRQGDDMKLSIQGNAVRRGRVGGCRCSTC